MTINQLESENHLLRSQIAALKTALEAKRIIADSCFAHAAAYRESLLACQRRAYTAMDWQHEAYIAGVLGVESLTKIDERKDDAP